MSESVPAQIKRLDGMSVGELHERYAEVFGESARSQNRGYLRRRIAWRIQELAEGGIPERLKAKALALARDADLRVVPPRMPRGVPVAAPQSQVLRDPRLPAIGTTITRTFRGTTHKVLVHHDGFEFGGRRFESLSAIAREITGTRWNGFVFFGLSAKQERSR